jgi:FkbM family methyltransferase
MYRIAIASELDLASTKSDEHSAKALTEIFIELINNHNVQNLFEIGSHDGASARNLIENSPTLYVYSAEANPLIHEKYAEINSGVRHNYRNICIGESNGKAVLRIPTRLSRVFNGNELVSQDHEEQEETGKSSLLYRDELADYVEMSVEQETLDEFVRSHLRNWEITTRDAALWIDVEGAQRQVLSESTLALERMSMVFIEMEGFPFWKNGISHFELLSLLEKHGFHPVSRDYEYGNYQFNVILLHESLIDWSMDPIE